MADVKLLDKVVQLVDDGRYLDAANVLDSMPTKVGSILVDLTEQQKLAIQELNDRLPDINSAIDTVKVDSTWTFGISYFGITTHYKLNPERPGTNNVDVKLS